jgi:hypothetical protein
MHAHNGQTIYVLSSTATYEREILFDQSRNICLFQKYDKIGPLAGTNTYNTLRMLNPRRSRQFSICQKERLWEIAKQVDVFFGMPG